MEKGWIKLYRDIQDNVLWQSDEPFDKKSAWIDLLLLANHEDKKVLFREGIVIVKRGQFVTSIGKLATRWSWSKDRVSRFLSLLESEHMICKESNNFRTVLTIENYGKFQDVPNSDKYANKDTNKDTSKDARKSQTRMIKNDKEIKNNKLRFSDDPERNREIEEALANGAILLPDGSLDYSGEGWKE